MSTKHVSVQTSHETSINFWAQKIREIFGENDSFALALLSEESSKINRLSEMSSSLGIPIYETYRFILPNEMENCKKLCNEMIRDGWKLSLRVSDLKEEQLIFRQLDIDADGVMVVIDKFRHLENFIVRINPYKIPVISGTLWVNKEDASVELVFGPHKWLTKSPPQGNVIFGCSYKYSYQSVKYTTDDPTTRTILFRCLGDVVWIILGLNIRQLKENQKSVYAEFHWHKSLGYRFLECSFSLPVASRWTSSTAWSGE